jgi:tetratricopeptide (TPR) repeat protein
MQKLLFILAFFFILVGTQAQNPTDVQLAEQYFRQGDYEKALVYYEKFYSDNPAPHYFVRMYDCLVQLDRFKEAEKAMKK